MAGFLDLLGSQTKPSYAQRPAKEHVIQGIVVSICRDGVVLQPTPPRIQKIQATIGDVLAKDDLAPHTANDWRDD